MYIRAIKKAPNPKNGVVYTTHQLVESHRTEKGPRQRTIMHLEALTLPRMRWRELAVALEAAVTGQPLPCPIAADIEAVAAAYLAQHGVKDALRHAEVTRKGKAGPQLVPVDLDTMSNTLSRSLGCELVGHAFYQRLGFPTLLAACGLDAYLVIERRDEAKAFEPEFEGAPEGFQETEARPDQERVWIKKLPALEAVAGEPALARVLCFSEGRAEKEQGMDRLKEERFLKDLEKLNKSIGTGYLKDTAKANQRIGRLLERYAAIASRYLIKLTLAADPSKTVGVTWARTDKVRTHETLQGCYVIQTTHVDYDAERIWALYMTLTRVEAAFRALKSDLGLRPVRHQGGNRTRAHLFVSVLAYHLLASIERTMHLKGDTRSWATLREELGTHQRSTITLRGATDTVHQVRLSSIPEAVHQEIYRLLEVRDPLARRRRELNVRV